MQWLLWIQITMTTIFHPGATLSLPGYVGSPVASEQIYATASECEAAREARMQEPLIVQGIHPDGDVLVQITTSAWCTLEGATS
jgi:hypothetical protein